METERFSLCWNNFHNNLRTGFQSLFQDEDLVDVTLAAEGRYIKAHKTVLSVCSPYFKDLFRANPCKHPIVILQDVNYSALHNLLQFMYQGEVSVRQEEIPTFMRVAETLKIKGLTENSTHNNAENDNLNGIDDNNAHQNNSYSNLDTSKQSVKRTRPQKKIIRPIQHLRPLESPKTIKSPHSSTIPEQPPTKQIRVEESDKKLPITPKLEPVYDNDDYNTLDTASFNTSPYPSGSWTPDEHKFNDVSSPAMEHNMYEMETEEFTVSETSPQKRKRPNLIIEEKRMIKNMYQGIQSRFPDMSAAELMEMCSSFAKVSPRSIYRCLKAVDDVTEKQESRRRKKMSVSEKENGTLQCVIGKRGNPRLIVDGHAFFKKSSYKGKSFWYCKHNRTSHKCPAVCWTYHGQIVKWPMNHSHFVIPEPLNPDEDVEVPIDQMQEVLIQSSSS